MSNRAHLLEMIGHVMKRMKNSANREERFDLLDNAQVLAGILQEVVQFERSLVTDLDVD